MRYLVTADWHLRASRPRCRKDDDWIDTQRQALSQIVQIAKREGVGCIVVAGDIFDSANEPYEIVCLAQNFARECAGLEIVVRTIAGNHDLPYHSLANVSKSAYGVFANSLGVSSRAYGFFDFGTEKDCDASVVALHTLTVPDKEIFVGDYETPLSLAKKYPYAKFIFVGDNHKQFIERVEKIVVVNSGCLVRQKYSEKDYVPRVVVVNTETGLAHTCKIDDAGDENIVDDYAVEEKKRDERIDAFAEKIAGSAADTLDFVLNVKTKIANEKIEASTEKIILEAIDEKR